METYHVVRYSGPFGYIKPWTAVRDDLTFSQQFLTPSIVEGMREKLGVEAILRHRLSHAGFSPQMETIQSPGWKETRTSATRAKSILTRGVMLRPVLHLALSRAEDAERTLDQHLCLCRNEDLLFPESWVEMDPADFDRIDGFELTFGEGPGHFLVGYNRFEGNRPMFGRVAIHGNPIQDVPFDL